jgi:hypothetical protein
MGRKRINSKSRARVDETLARLLALSRDEQELLAFRWQFITGSPIDRLVKEGIEARNAAVLFALAVAERLHARGELTAENLRAFAAALEAEIHTMKHRGPDARKQTVRERNAVIEKELANGMAKSAVFPFMLEHHLVLMLSGKDPIDEKSMWDAYHRRNSRYGPR